MYVLNVKCFINKCTNWKPIQIPKPIKWGIFRKNWFNQKNPKPKKHNQLGFLKKPGFFCNPVQCRKLWRYKYHVCINMSTLRMDQHAWDTKAFAYSPTLRNCDIYLPINYTQPHQSAIEVFGTSATAPVQHSQLSTLLPLLTRAAVSSASLTSVCDY